MHLRSRSCCLEQHGLLDRFKFLVCCVYTGRSVHWLVLHQKGLSEPGWRLGHICPESWTGSVWCCQVLQGFPSHLRPARAPAGQWKCSAGGNWGNPYTCTGEKGRFYANHTISFGTCETEGKNSCMDEILVFGAHLSSHHQDSPRHWWRIKMR